MHKHNLEYPHFYSRLYALLGPGMLDGANLPLTLTLTLTLTLALSLTLTLTLSLTLTLTLSRYARRRPPHRVRQRAAGSKVVR